VFDLPFSLRDHLVATSLEVHGGETAGDSAPSASVSDINSKLVKLSHYSVMNVSFGSLAVHKVGVLVYVILVYMS